MEQLGLADASGEDVKCYEPFGVLWHLPDLELYLP